MTDKYILWDFKGEGVQSMSPQNMPLQYADYFELKAQEKQ